MKRKIIGIILSMLLITTAIQAVGTIENDNFAMRKNSSYNSLIKQASPSSFNPGFWKEQDILNAPDGEYYDFYGYSVSTDGNYAAIGAYGDDYYRGSVYIFKRTGTAWSFEKKLLAPDGYDNHNFGCSVSLDGERVLIGAFGDESYMGSAYIFKRTGTSWYFEAKLQDYYGDPSDIFGWFVSLKGDYALIGSPGDDGYKGSAYIFQRSGSSWTQQYKLTASDGTSGDRFGRSVSLYGDYALIGAWYDDNWKGSAYVFKRSGQYWYQEDKLVASDGVASDLFGESVSLYGDYALISSQGDDDNGDNSGSAYIFKRSGTNWIQQQKLLASDGASSDYFGSSVSLYDNCALIGAALDDTERGSAYIFKRYGTSWSQRAKLTASDATIGDRFGYVSLYGDYALIGAYFKGNYQGSAYVFKYDDPLEKVPLIEFIDPSVLNFRKIPLGLLNTGNGSAEDITWEMEIIDGGGIFRGKLFNPKYQSGYTPLLGPGQDFGEDIDLRGLGLTTVRLIITYTLKDLPQCPVEFKVKKDYRDLGVTALQTIPKILQPDELWNEVDSYEYYDESDQQGVELYIEGINQWHNVGVIYNSDDRANEVAFIAMCKFTDGHANLVECGITRDVVMSEKAHWVVETLNGK